MYPVYGVDVSEWQGRPPGVVRPNDRTIDWTVMVRKAYFAFIKASSGYKHYATNLREDPAWMHNAIGSREVGMVRGFYHLLAPDRDIKTQLATFLECLALYPGELPAVLDIEVPKPGAMQKNTLLNAIEKAVKYMQDNGHDPIIYTRKTWWDAALYKAGGNLAWRCMLWTAHYNSEITQPWIPEEWTNHGKTWTFWQYSADGNGRAREYGCAGAPYSDEDIDINVFNGSLAGFNDKFRLDLKPLPEVVEPPVDDGIQAGDLVQIMGTVNPRSGPGVNYTDLGTLTNGVQTKAIGSPANGFVPLEVWAAEQYVKKQD
jgi:lysozyme